MSNKGNKHHIERLATLPDNIKKQVNSIQSLVGVTQADFLSLYVTMIGNIIAYLTEPNQAFNEDALVRVLEKTVLSLKKRQGYLLPLGADSEVIFREREEWTYAIFTAALLQVIDEKNRFILSKALIPHQAYAWLHRNSALFFLWEAYLRGNDKENFFAEMIDIKESTRVVELPIMLEHIDHVLMSEVPQAASVTLSTLKVPDTNHNLPAIGEPIATVLDEIPEKPVIRSVNLQMLQPSVSAPLKTEPVIQNEESLSTINSHSFLEWLTHGLSSGKIEYNQDNSIAQRVKEGLLILIPEAVSGFLNAIANEKGLAVDALYQHEATLTREIKKMDGLMRNSQGSRIHVYCIGNWEERKTLSGILVDTAILDVNIQQLPMNSKLAPDPMADI